jgi:hypothetical protein
MQKVVIFEKNMSSNRKFYFRFKNPDFMRVFVILTPKRSSKKPFFGQKPEILFPGQKSAFFICSARKVNRQESQARHIDNGISGRQSTPERYSRAVEDNVPEHGPAEAGRRRACG